nr:hypothetical protein [Tanacetum cinerariifolium]
MSTQQDIYVAGSKNHLPMLNKDNYIPWSSRLLRYTKSKPNGKVIYNSIIHCPYVRRMIHEPGDPDREVPVAETFHEQTDDELTEKKTEHMIVVGAENHPPMLNKSMYNLWQSCMLLYIKRKKNGRMMLESIENGPLIYLTIEENGVIRTKIYVKLTKQEQLQDDYDVQATNIVLQGLSPDVYALVNQCQTAKDIWERVKLLMQGIELSYQGEWHMARQCTQPKRPKNSAWFKEKMLLVQTQESGQVLDEEQLAFLVDYGIADVQDSQTTITHNAAFQTDDLDAYDSDCDDISSAKVVLMANLLSYNSDVLSEVTQHDTYQNNDMFNQSVQEMQYFKQSLIDYVPDTEITSDSNIFSYEQYL